MTELRGRLKRRLQQVVGLTEHEADQVASEVLDLFSQTVDEFVVARHAELQSEGQPSEVCYRRIRTELDDWRFRAPLLSLRQIRRRIYG